MGEANIRIDKQGNMHVEVNGVEGSACEELTKDLISRVGDVEDQAYTEEYVQELPDLIEQFEE